MDKCLTFTLILVLHGMCRAQISKDATITTSAVTPSTTVVPLPTPTDAGTTQSPVVTTVAPSTECTDNPCQNGAICSLVNGQTTCTCLNGYHGNFCQSRTRTFFAQTRFTRAVFGSRIFLTVTPNSPLNDKTSAEFLGVCAALQALVRASLGRALRIHCIAFRAGSVIADYAIEMESSTSETDLTIAKSISSGLANMSYVAESGSNQLLTTNDTAGVTVGDYDECSGNVTGYCDSSATCKNTIGSYECVCEPGKNLVGNKCVSPTTTESNEMIAIYITIGVLAGLLLLLLLLVLIVAVRRNRGQSTFRNEPSAPFLPPGLRAQAALPGREEIDWNLYRSSMQ